MTLSNETKGLILCLMDPTITTKTSMSHSIYDFDLINYVHDIPPDNNSDTPDE